MAGQLVSALLLFVVVAASAQESVPAAPQPPADASSGTPAPGPTVDLVFQDDPLPDPEHGVGRPGPGSGQADRAGYAEAIVHKHLIISWSDEPPGADGRIPLYIVRATAGYRLHQSIHISSDYELDTCPYRETLAHEREHAAAFRRLFNDSREGLRSALSAVGGPTRTSPMRVTREDLEAAKANWSALFNDAIRRHGADLRTAMERDRSEKDAPAAYAVVYARCPASQW
jgi:hypothetical protein